MSTVTHDGMRHVTGNRLSTSHDRPEEHPLPNNIIFVTNRGPIEHEFDRRGHSVAHRGAGGVVTGLISAAEGRNVTWIALAMTDADRIAARNQKASQHPLSEAPTLHPVLVSVPQMAYHRYYDGFSNRILWFTQHGMAHTLKISTLRAYWEDGYKAVNQAVADKVVDSIRAAGSATPVMFHDYHLYLAPRMVRDRMPQALLHHFVHIPWPEPRMWERLPRDIVRSIFDGLLANDTIGMQTQRDTEHFAAGAMRYLRGAWVSTSGDAIHWRGHTTVLRAHPIAVTPSSIRAAAHSAPAERKAAALLRRAGVAQGRKLILRVDRVEPTKNIVRGFRAYERLLRLHPHLHGKVVFLALLVPSRETMREYREYSRKVREIIARINTMYGTDGWEPVIAVYGNDHARALACMRQYDVLLVNPLIDGMNLVVKEGGLVNERNGVIVLSDKAGAHAQLRDGTLGINARSVVATANALYQALVMPVVRRARMANWVRIHLQQESAGQWLTRQLVTLMQTRNHRDTGHTGSTGLRITIPHPRIELDALTLNPDRATGGVLSLALTHGQLNPDQVD